MSDVGFAFWIVVKVVVASALVVGLVLPSISRAQRNMQR